MVAYITTCMPCMTACMKTCKMLYDDVYGSMYDDMYGSMYGDMYVMVMPDMYKAMHSR